MIVRSHCACKYTAFYQFVIKTEDYYYLLDQGPVVRIEAYHLFIM